MKQAMAILIMLISACGGTPRPKEVNMKVSGISFENTWFACGMDKEQGAKTDPDKIEKQCLASPLIESAQIKTDKNKVLHIQVKGANPGFYVIAEDEVDLISQTGKRMISDCEFMGLNLPVVTLYDIKADDRAFERITADVANFMKMLRQFDTYKPTEVEYHPFAGFIVTFKNPLIKIEFGEKDLKKKIKMVPRLVMKASKTTGFPSKVVIVDSQSGIWASISTYKTSYRRRR